MNLKNIAQMILFHLVSLYFIKLVDPQSIIIKNGKKAIGLALNLNPLKDPKKAPIGY